MSKVKKITNRTKNAMQTKKKLFDVAVSLFIKNGFNNVTIADITSKAGFGKGTFYGHFHSKEAVVVEYFTLIDNVYQSTFDNVDSTMGAKEQLILLTDTMAKYCSKEYNVEILKTVYSSQLLVDNKFKNVMDKNRFFYKKIEEIVILGIKNKEFTSEIPLDSMLSLIEKSIHGLMYDWCMYNGSFDLVKETKFYITQVMKMLI